MKNKHLIMGTAGHVDHGKTTLIKALTGYDCDTHKQEKERGITINLGFSHIDFAGGNSVGIVDVPGHASFIKTMVSGACGIDFMLLIIAADEGIMPQTKEHFEIMKMLGVKFGIIVQTKIDLVDEELSEISQAEISEFVEGSFLENAPLIGVSAETGDGIEELLQAISRLTETIPARDSAGVFRMYIDRVFVKKGFGTIANGSVISGKIKKTDKIFILPKNKEIRIRSMQRHGSETDEIYAGDRASFNLVGLKQKEIQKGMLLSDRIVESTKLIDVKITIFNEINLGLWNQVIFILGSNHLVCRLHLLDQNNLSNGENCLAQIYLPQEIVAFLGDKFIMRNSSGNTTIGGGEIIDPHPLHHRRRRKQQIEIVKEIAFGGLKSIISAEVRKSEIPISHFEIAQKLNLNADDLLETIFQKLSNDIVFYQTENEIILLSKKQNTALQNKILTGLQNYHRKNPLLETGRTFKEISGIFGEKQTEITKKTLQKILVSLVENNKILKYQNSWVLVSHEVKIDAETKLEIEKIEGFIKSQKNNFVEKNEILNFGKNNKIVDQKINSILTNLTATKQIYFLQNKIFSADFLQRCQKILVKFLTENEVGIKTSQFRDLIASNRGATIIILEYFDSENITLRKGDFRFLTNRFRETL